MKYATVVLLALVTACASAPTSADLTTLVPITIENNRTNDVIDPRFRLVGSGSHDLGIVGGMGGRLRRMIDTRWFDANGCMTIVAHYVGGRDLTFDRFCWRHGERIDVALDDIFNPVAAWAHR
jgi:hypothetical protein